MAGENVIFYRITKKMGRGLQIIGEIFYILQRVEVMV